MERVRVEADEGMTSVEDKEDNGYTGECDPGIG